MTGAAPTPAVARLLGTVVSGRYRIEELIAESPTGALFRGEHVHMHKRIAVKVLFAGAASQAEHLARFEREAIAGAHVDHPAVAAAKDFGTLDDGAQFLVVEYLDGPTLAVELGRGPLPLDRALHVARQIALGLDAAHAIGIVHRSLSPEKVHLVARGGDRDIVKVVDFSLALLPHALVAESAQGGEGRAQRVATPIGAVPTSIAYAAPELVAGRPVDGRADLYSLGAMLFEMLTGRRPEVARGAAPPPLAGVPAAVEALVHRLLAEDPELRPPTAAAAVDEIDAAQPAPPRRAAPSAGALPGGGRGSLPAVPSASASALARAPETTAPTVMTNETSGRRSLALLAADASGAAAAIVMPGGAARALPTPVLFAAGGGLAIILVVVAAIALRSPASEAALDDAPPGSTAAASSAPSPRSTRGAASPVTDVSQRAPERPAVPEGAREVWSRLSAEVGSRRCKEAVVSLERLLELDPKAPEDREVRAAIVRLAQDVMLLEGPEPDKMFDLVSTQMGTTGPDILYELMTTRGGSRAARRSEDLLRDADIRDRGTPALRIAYELRAAKKCEDKIALFERAKTDGDGRTLGLLQLLNHSCGRRNADCCLHNDPALKATMEAIKNR